MKSLSLIPLKTTMAVCQVEDYSKVSMDQPLLFIAKTDEENSVVCPVDGVPNNALVCDQPWRGFRVEGVLDFSMVGVLSRLSAILAEEGVSIFAVSTYNTDYILVREADLDRALGALQAKGYEIGGG